MIANSISEILKNGLRKEAVVYMKKDKNYESSNFRCSFINSNNI